MKQKDLSVYKNLFIEEEISADRLVNYVRFFISLAVIILALLKADVFGDFTVTKASRITLILISIALVYSSILYIILRKGIYFSFIKYISVTIDITLVVFSIYVYKFDLPAEHAKIYFLARYGLLFIVMFFTLLRYNFWISVYSGVLAAAEYFFLVIMNNMMTGMDFTFTGVNGITHAAQFDPSEAYLRIIYILTAGVTTGVFALRLKKLVKTSIMKEQEKNKLAMDNKIIETVNRENKKYLDNINEGLLLVNHDYVIKSLYSKFLEDIFETDLIGGTHFVDFIYPDIDANAEERKELERFLKILFNNTLTDMDMIMDVNPLRDKKIEIIDNAGNIRHKVINASFFKIENHKKVEELMVIFEDKTEMYIMQQELEDEKSRRQTELEYIAAIIRTNEHTLKDFLEDLQDAVEDLENNLDNLTNTRTLHRIFRKMHSVKGTAGTIEFVHIADYAHTVEDYLAQIRDDNVAVDTDMRERITRQLNNIHGEFDMVTRVKEQFLQYRHVNDDEQGTSMQAFLTTLEKMSYELADDLDKDISVTIDNLLDEPVLFNKIKNPLIHLMRNSIDHGIEEKYERLASGKNQKAKINLKLFNDNDNYIVELSDDGRGINFGKIKSRAQEMDLLHGKPPEKVSKNELLGILFSPGFSTKNTVSKTSGRGVGLDAVKDAINELHGKISVSTRQNQGTKFTIRIPRKMNAGINEENG